MEQEIKIEEMSAQDFKDIFEGRKKNHTHARGAHFSVIKGQESIKRQRIEEKYHIKQEPEPIYINANHAPAVIQYKTHIHIIGTVCIGNKEHDFGHNENFEFITLQKGYIVDSCSFIGDVYFEKVVLTNESNFVWCNFKGVLQLKTPTLKKLIFSNCIFEDVVFINSCNLDNEYNSFKLEPINSQIEFNECTFKKPFLKERGHYHSLNFTNCIFEDSLKIEDVSKTIIKNEHDKIKKSIKFLYLNLSKTTEAITISNQFIINLECSGNLSGTFICRDSTINNLTFNDFTNEKDFKLLNIKSESTDGKLIIKDSYLGKMYWSSVDFSSWKHAQVFNSTLIDLILTNVKLPKNFISKTETDFEGIKEAYRQLKYVFSKQGDLVEELKYKQLEMHAFRKTSNMTCGDKTILWLNRWSNNFGQDWRNAGSGILIISLIGFTTIKYLLGETNFCWDNVPVDVVAFLKLLINPLHYDMKSVFSKECAGANLIYVSTKLLNLFFSVQLVLAFRKFAKS